MEAGRKRLGRFLVHHQLGDGGSGVVYAIDYDDGRTPRAALKVLRTERAASEGESRRFLAEAERMARLSHPSLVPLLESGYLPDGRPYLVMPLLEGETAGARIARGPLPLSSALRIFAQVASGLSAVHDAGLVHRDVKPENVFLVDRSPDLESTRAILLDFGIAREIEAGPSTATIAGLVYGTAAYMAPERFFGTPASVRSDVYELGVLLYVLLTGRLPWTAEADASERLDPPDPRSFRAEIPPALAAVVLRALSTRPEKRPQTVAELARAVVDASQAEERSADARRTADVPVMAPPAAFLGARTAEVPAMRPEMPSDLGGVIGPPASAAPSRARPLLVAASSLLAVGVITAGVVVARGLRAGGGPVTPDVPVPTSQAVTTAAAPEPSAPAPVTAASSDAPAVVASASSTAAPSASHVVVRARPAAVKTTAATSSSVAPITTRRREDWYEDRK